MTDPEDRGVGGTPADEADRIRAVFEARDQRRSERWLTSGSPFLSDERWRCAQEILRRELPSVHARVSARGPRS
jgi:hypothetical protein